MQLSFDQQQALQSLLDWQQAKIHTKYITLGGYAGTGKTSLIALLRKELYRRNKKLEAAFCSYTGKAARVLKSALKKEKALYRGDSVSTIHGLIYSPVINAQEEITGWQRKTSIESDLIIVDEASMIDRTIWDDLLAYNIPMIAVGDHSQLPPIHGSFNLMEKPMLRLEQIHRQARENPIIKLSILAREQGKIQPGNYGSGVVKYHRGEGDVEQELADLLSGFNSDTLILCGYNSTRIKVNNYVRSAKEIELPTPMNGDRVICLRNNHISKIYNGMLGTIVTVTLQDKNWYYAEIELDDEDKLYKGLISVEQFNSPQALNFTRNRKQTKSGDLFDFGYALTVHKAQGSQAEKVILLEERFPQMDELTWRRWLYTAVTRAEKKLYIFGY